MRREMIRRYSIELVEGLGQIQPAIDSSKLRTLHKKRDFLGMVRYIRDSLHLNQLKIRVGIVNNGGPKNSPAWISPPTMPVYGSQAFRDTLVTMHIRRPFLEKSPFEAVVACMAHELSHIVLGAINHNLQHEEEAVDLAAMMLGYRDFFPGGSTFENFEKLIDDDVPFSGFFNAIIAIFTGSVVTHQLGYLSREEVRFAKSMMDFGLSGSAI